MLIKKKRNRVPVIYFCLIFHSNQIELSLIMNTKTKMIIKWYGWEHLKKNASLISLNTVHHNYVWILMTKPKFDRIFINSHSGIRVSFNWFISTCSDVLLYMRRDLFVLLERTIHQFDNGCTRTINVIHSVMASIDSPDHHSPKQTANYQNLSSRVWFIH